MQMKEKAKLQIFFEENPYQNNQCPLWCTDDFTENTGLRYFFTEWKKMQKLNESKKWPGDIYLTVVQDKEN